MGSLSCHCHFSCFRLSVCCPNMLGSGSQGKRRLCIHRYLSCHVMSCHVMSCHVLSCHVMSHALKATHINFICPMRFDNFPLDTQTCKFQVGSYSYDMSKMAFDQTSKVQGY